MGVTAQQRVLIIDDEPGARQSLADYLADLDFVVTTADNGRLGLASIAQQRPDVVLLDLRMPEMSGLELLERLRNEAPTLPTIVVSGAAQVADAVEALRLGAWDYLIKPVLDLSLVRLAIERAFEKAQLLEQSRRFQAELERRVSERTADLERALRQLRDSRQTSDEIVRSIPSGLLIYQFEPPDRLILRDGNPAAGHLLNRDVAALRGRLLSEIFPAAEKADITTRFLEVVATGRTWEVDDGEYCDDAIRGRFRVVAFPLPEQKLAVAFEDVAERRRAAAEQRELERRWAKNQKLESLAVMAGGIAHDYNNLLMIVLGHLELLTPKLPPTTDMRVHVQRAVEAARRASTLTQHLLAYTGNSPLTPADVDLNAVCRTRVAEVRALVPGNQQISLTLASALPTAWVDGEQIGQVMTSLLVNAVESLTTGSAGIEVKTGVCHADAAMLARNLLQSSACPGEYIVCEIADTGCGMDAATLERIFDPFFSTKFTGRGLSMAAVKGIVESHGGVLLIDSSVGRGTVVRLLLPAKAAPAPAPAAVVAPTIASPTGVRMPTCASGDAQLLVIDSDPKVRDITVALADRLGRPTLAANDGAEAIALLREHRDTVFCVLLDVVTPGPAAVATAEALRAIQPDLRIILCSGCSKQEVMARCQIPNLAGYLAKPFQIEQLAEILADTCGATEP